MVSVKDLQKRHKDVWVITTDTLVENPIVTQWVNYSLEIMDKNAQKEKLPIYEIINATGKRFILD